MKYENKTLSLVVDMYGCPNRCKHCWIKHFPNGNMSNEEAKQMVEYFEPYFNTITYYSWAREPDYCKDYKKRWEDDLKLSINSKPLRFELASFYRIVRDETYPSFLKEVGTDVVQLTFFGLEEKTDYYVGRKNAYKELLEATEILIKYEIAPRWQIFINEDNKEEIKQLIELSETLKLKERCNKFNKEFKLFIYEGDCIGNNANLYDIRICNIDEQLIPYYLDYENTYSEKDLCEMYKEDTSTMNLTMGNDIVLYVFENGDVFYNLGTFDASWCIGNWKKENSDSLIKKIVNEEVEAIKEAKQITISKLIEKYGNKTSERLFKFDDYKMYLLNKHLKRL